MTSFSRSDDLQGARFVEVNLRRARFIGSDLSGAVIRGAMVDGAEIDAPWLLDGDGSLVVNGVDVAPLVEVELNARYPGRAERRAQTADGLRAAWKALEQTWAGVVERVAAMPETTPDVSVDGEWSFAETLRHLVFATDAWLGGAVLGVEQPFHPLGLPRTGAAEEDGLDMSPFSSGTPDFEDVLAARADRLALVRDFLAGVTDEQLAAPRKNPWDPRYPETTLNCVLTVLEEEWEHLRYAVRDLDAVEAGAGR
jgi:hypothetical protein